MSIENKILENQEKFKELFINSIQHIKLSKDCNFDNFFINGNKFACYKIVYVANYYLEYNNFRICNISFSEYEKILNLYATKIVQLIENEMNINSEKV